MPYSTFHNPCVHYVAIQDEDDFVQEDNSMVVDDDFGKSPAEAAFLGSISPGFNAPIHSLR